MAETPQIYVKITATLAHMHPPKDRQEEIMRELAENKLQALATRMEKGVAELLKVQCLPEKVNDS